MRSSRDKLQLNHFKWNLLPCTTRVRVRGLCTSLCRSETVTKGGTEMISWKMSGAHASPVPVQTGLLRGDKALLLFSHLPVVNQLGTYDVSVKGGSCVNARFAQHPYSDGLL